VLFQPDRRDFDPTRSSGNIRCSLAIEKSLLIILLTVVLFREDPFPLSSFTSDGRQQRPTTPSTRPSSPLPNPKIETSKHPNENKTHVDSPSSQPYQTRDDRSPESDQLSRLGGELECSVDVFSLDVCCGIMDRGGGANTR
jgi:hypothetical protein